MGYLSERALNGLKAYEYKSGGYTALDNLHRPILDWCCQFLPLWLAPNLITLLGTMGLVLSYAASAYYAPDFVGYAPRWVYWFAAFSVVWYTWLDCFDGKHARRTGTSSPLGQLFDHGCDALSVNLLLAGIGSSLGIPCSWSHGLGMFGVMFIWICAQWEEYHTGNMVYGNEYFGVLECNYSLALVHVFTAIVGPEFFQQYVRDVIKLPVVTDLIGDWKMCDFTIVFFISMGSYQAVCNVYRIYHHNAASMPAKERGNKQLGQGAAFAHLGLILCMTGLCGLWLSMPCTVPYVCRLESLGVGFAYSLFASQLIMAHMCKEPFEAPGWAMLLVGVSVLNKALGILPVMELTLAVTTLLLLGYLHYVVVVIRQICAHLDIWCLTIKPKGKPANNNKAAAAPASPAAYN